MTSNLLAGRSGLIMGVANKRSLAWAIAVAAAQHGATIGITYQDERMLRRVQPLTEEIPVATMIPCDVSQDEQIEQAFDQAEAQLGKIDFVVHSIAFANKEDLDNDFIKTSRQGFALANDISAYSFLAIGRAAQPFLEKTGGSMLALTFEGARRVFPNYNVMGVAKAALEATVRHLAYDLGKYGIRVNALSAGPIKTLASSAVRGLSHMQQVMAEKAPLRRNITPEEVADAAVFLISPMARGITGEIVHVDAGYHIMGF